MRCSTFFARAENRFDVETESFGTFGENVLEEERVERFLSPGALLGGWFGARVVLRRRRRRHPLESSVIDCGRAGVGRASRNTSP